MRLVAGASVRLLAGGSVRLLAAGRRWADRVTVPAADDAVSSGRPRLPQRVHPPARQDPPVGAGLMAAGLLLPLTRLEPPAAPRTLDLEPPPALARWASTVRTATEPALLLDDGGRVAAVSAAAGRLLGLDATAVGSLLTQLITVVDHTAAALPMPGGAEQLPCLRVLGGPGAMARALVRLRRHGGPGEVVALDAVGVAVEGGALAFFSEL